MRNLYSHFDGFRLHFNVDDDDNFTFSFLELPTISATSKDAREGIKMLLEKWDSYKKECVEKQKPIPLPLAFREYSGQFNVRLDKRVHRALAIEASRAGISLNALVAQKLLQSVERQIDIDD